MKHMIVDYHFVCDQVSKKHISVSHVHLANQLANLLTKSLSFGQQYQSQQSKLTALDETLILQSHERKTPSFVIRPPITKIAIRW